MIAHLNLRTKIRERWDAFHAGLAVLGFQVKDCAIDKVDTLPVDGILVTWNRIGVADRVARAFEAAGRPVVVVENPSWGKLVPGHWLQVASCLHNTRGRVPYNGPERWDALGVPLAPMRTGDGETVVLAQRGIGSPPVAMPRGWTQQNAHRGRVRQHPNDGLQKVAPLAHDLRNARRVVHWSSAAGIEALALGIENANGYAEWIGACDGTETGRLGTFRRMAWSQWRLEEIASGAALQGVLH